MIANDAITPVAIAVVVESKSPAQRDQTTTNVKCPANHTPLWAWGNANALTPSMLKDPMAPIHPVSLPISPRVTSQTVIRPTANAPAALGAAHAAGHQATTTTDVTPISTARCSVSGTVAQMPAIEMANAGAPIQCVRRRQIPSAAMPATRAATATINGEAEGPRLDGLTSSNISEPVLPKAPMTAAPQTIPQSAKRSGST